jgi:hypothetical protein
MRPSTCLVRCHFSSAIASTLTRSLAGLWATIGCQITILVTCAALALHCTFRQSSTFPPFLLLIVPYRQTVKSKNAKADRGETIIEHSETFRYTI